jgi:hypothetical protein
MPISAIAQWINLFICNKCFVECRAKVVEFLSRDVLWPPKILYELLANTATSRSHMVTLYDLAIGLFQFKTSPIAGVAKEF